MSTQVLVRKLNQQIEALRKDVKEIKGVLWSAAEDDEGPYRAAFVRKLLQRAREKPRYRYAGKEAFLKHLNGGPK